MHVIRGRQVKCSGWLSCVLDHSVACGVSLETGNVPQQWCLQGIVRACLSKAFLALLYE